MTVSPTRLGPTIDDRYQHSTHDPANGCELIADSRTLPPFFTPSGLAIAGLTATLRSLLFFSSRVLQCAERAT